VSTYASDFAITVSPSGDTITVSVKRLYHLDQIDAAGVVIAYIGCVQTRTDARRTRRREARDRQVPLGRITVSRGAR
jgi:hypothetical protein